MEVKPLFEGLEQSSELDSLLNHFEKRIVQDGEKIFSQDELADRCFYIQSGLVDTYSLDADIQALSKMDTYYSGELVGAVGVIDSLPRAISAVANGKVELFEMNQTKLNQIMIESPQTYQQFLKLAATTLSKKYRSMQEVVKAHAVFEGNSPVLDEMVAKVKKAQGQLLNLSEGKIDQLIQDIADAVYEEAESLAEQTVSESGMGVLEHKILKIKLGTVEVAQSLVGKPGHGTVQVEAPNVESMAMPMGVVFGLIPITNPVETMVFKVLISIKSRNGIVVSNHRKGRGVGERTLGIIHQVLTSHGVSTDLVQTPKLPANRKVTNAIMKHEGIDFILATGGPSMVKSAYQSGTPAIGVGKGNAPVWICEDAHLNQAIQSVVNSKSFDNGIVCGSENNLIVDQSITDQFIEFAIDEGAAYLDESEIQRLVATIYAPYGKLYDQWVGQSAEKICEAAQIKRDYPIKLILAPFAKFDRTSPLLREKLVPVLSVNYAESDQQALDWAKEILSFEGEGHTAIIHSDSKEKILAFSAAVSVSRVLVNTPGTQGCIGAANGLKLSWTLGCGTYGGGSTSDNVSYTHLQNSKRIAMG